MFQTEGLLSAGRRKGPWWVLSISPRFKGCLKQAPALSFRHGFTTPKKVPYAGSGRRFSMAGPAALPSPQPTGKSETKWVVHAGGKAVSGLRKQTLTKWASGMMSRAPQFGKVMSWAP